MLDRRIASVFGSQAETPFRAILPTGHGSSGASASRPITLGTRGATGRALVPSPASRARAAPIAQADAG